MHMYNAQTTVSHMEACNTQTNVSVTGISISILLFLLKVSALWTVSAQASLALTCLLLRTRVEDRLTAYNPKTDADRDILLYILEPHLIEELHNGV